MALTNSPTLNAMRNQKKLKHIMLGNMIWDSLTSDFQIKLMAEETSFKQGNDFDSALLWSHIVNHVNPLTKASIGNPKEKLESAKMDDFGQDMKKFNTWPFNQCNMIIKEDGKEGYTEYLHSLFQAYKTAKDKAFVKAIKNKKMKWMIGSLPLYYKHKDLLKFILKLFNNNKATYKWDRAAKEATKKSTEDTKFLATMTNLKLLKKEMEVARINLPLKTKLGGREKELVRIFRPWQFKNKEGKETLEAHGRTYCWCTNDCHPKLMWCIWTRLTSQPILPKRKKAEAER
eukprot:8552012-Ditylum_brightwellii.AAC.1